MAIGLVVPDASSAFFDALAREIEDAAFARGYTLLLGNAMEDEGLHGGLGWAGAGRRPTRRGG